MEDHTIIEVETGEVEAEEATVEEEIWEKEEETFNSGTKKQLVVPSTAKSSTFSLKSTSQSSSTPSATASNQQKSGF